MKLHAQSHTRLPSWTLSFLLVNWSPMADLDFSL